MRTVCVRPASVGLLVLGLCAVFTAWGQSTGRLTGVVRDQTGGTVADAKISLFRPGGTDAEIQTKTTAEGIFNLDSLNPLTYRLVVEKDSFATFEYSDVKVSPGVELPLNGIVLQLGQTKATVVSEEKVEGVQTSNAQVSTTLTTEQLERLPLLGRNPLDLVKTQAGISTSGATSFGFPVTATVIDGQRTSFSNITFEGIGVQDNLNRSRGLDVLPSTPFLGQVAEFTLITSNASSAYGNGATQITFAAPTGSNTFHGSLYYLNVNNLLNANDYFQNQRGLKNDYKTHQGGFALGAPLVKNRLLSYINYEFVRVRNGYASRVSTLNAADRSFLGTFPTDPTVKRILDRVPLPNTPATGLLYDSYLHSQSQRADTDSAIARLDYIVSQRNSLTGTYIWSRNDIDQLDNASSLPFFTSLYGTRAAVVRSGIPRVLSLSWRATPSSRWTNEIRGGFSDDPSHFANTENPFPYYVNLGALNFINPTSSYPNNGHHTNTYNFQDNASVSLGRHNLQFGFQTQLIRSGYYDTSLSSPVYFLGDASLPQSPSEQFQAILKGQIYFAYQLFNVTSRTSGLQPVPLQLHYGYDNYAFYLQDNWKPARNLALTLGLRYEYYPTLRERDSLFFVPQLKDNDINATLNAPSVSFDLAGGDGRPLYRSSKKNFAPSIGLAFDPFGRGKSVFRAAYSIAYVNDDTFGAIFGTLQSNTFLPRISILQATPSQRFIGTLATPPVLGPPAMVLALGLSAPGVSDVSIVDPGLRVPYVQQWSVGVQQEFAGFVGDLRYIGNHAVKMLREAELNSNYHRTLLSNFSSSTYSGLQAGLSRRIRSGLQMQTNYVFSKTLSDSGRISDGATEFFRDPTNRSLDHTRAFYDIRHAFKANLIYDLPFGPGRHFASVPLRPLVAGWSLSGILIAQSGAPFSILSDRLKNNTANASSGGSALNDLIGFHRDGNGAYIIPPSAVNPNDGTGVGFPGQVFFSPPPGSPGQLQLRSFSGPNSFDMDLGVQKLTHIAEHHSVEFRADAINVLNHPSFYVGDQSIKESGFGRQNILSLYHARRVQLSLYYRF